MIKEHGNILQLRTCVQQVIVDTIDGYCDTLRTLYTYHLRQYSLSLSKDGPSQQPTKTNQSIK
jgi:hypothetical protein